MLLTRVGRIESGPQDVQRGFRSKILDVISAARKRSLAAAMLEMHIKGVSTRLVKTITGPVLSPVRIFQDQPYCE
jgi:transposase-like protein